MTLCKYKDLFGKPNQGVHSYRIFGFALFDILGTVVLALLISRAVKSSFWKVFLLLFIAAEILHYLFCVDTAFMKMIKRI